VSGIATFSSNPLRARTYLVVNRRASRGNMSIELSGSGWISRDWNRLEGLLKAEPFSVDMDSIRATTLRGCVGCGPRLLIESRKVTLENRSASSLKPWMELTHSSDS
jgi:hypothetical protein